MALADLITLHLCHSSMAYFIDLRISYKSCDFTALRNETITLIDLESCPPTALIKVASG